VKLKKIVVSLIAFSVIFLGVTSWTLAMDKRVGKTNTTPQSKNISTQGAIIEPIMYRKPKHPDAKPKHPDAKPKHPDAARRKTPSNKKLSKQRQEGARKIIRKGQEESGVLIEPTALD
jgi:hypothetical protein